MIQDDFFATEEIKKYKLLKNNRIKEKYSIYHKMFLYESSILLVDGYLVNGKILYASQNFSLLFSYNGKELLNMNIDDLVPNVIQNFHKELIENAIKYSNIKYIFNKPKDFLLKNKEGELYQIKLFVKPVPNLSQGLIYYNYIQKINENNYIILLDKEFIIYGFKKIENFGLNSINFNSKLLGNHIGLIIPDILLLLEYKNEEFNINKIGSELKGYIYPIENINNLKIKVDNILKKIKNNKIGVDYQESINENSQNIIDEYNELLKEYNIQKKIPINIFFKIQFFSFLDGKYKYYRIYINNDIIEKDEFDPSNQSAEINNKNSHNSTKLKKIEKIIKINNVNEDENFNNSKEKVINNENPNNKDELKIKKINSRIINNSNSNDIINVFNKIKSNIINKNEIFPIKIR